MNIMYVCINQSALKVGQVKGRENYYECIRKYWELNEANLKKAKQVDYVAGVFNGIVLDIYKPRKWDIVRNFPDMLEDFEVKKNPKYLNCYAFEGDSTGNDVPAEVKKKYKDKPYPKKFSRDVVYHFFEE